MSTERIDYGGIAVLSRQVADDGTASLRFVDDFIALWPTRVERIRIGARGADVDQALAALLSIATSSAMIGALTLGAAARSLYDESRYAGRINADGVDRLSRLGDAACFELRAAADVWSAGLAS